jgi:hypothetical protein
MSCPYRTHRRTGGLYRASSTAGRAVAAKCGSYSEWPQAGIDLKPLEVHVGGIEPHFTLIDWQFGLGPKAKLTPRFKVPRPWWASSTRSYLEAVRRETSSFQAICADTICPKFPVLHGITIRVFRLLNIPWNV